MSARRVAGSVPSTVIINLVSVGLIVDGRLTLIAFAPLLVMGADVLLVNRRARTERSVYTLTGTYSAAVADREVRAYWRLTFTNLVVVTTLLAVGYGVPPHTPTAVLAVGYVVGSLSLVISLVRGRLFALGYGLLATVVLAATVHDRVAFTSVLAVTAAAPWLLSLVFSLMAINVHRYKVKKTVYR